jgi:cystathionine beta-lyase
VLFLCHPHNPTGMIWSDADLLRIGQICADHDIVIVSDEVHCDLRRHNQSHTPLAKLMPDSEHIVTCMSPAKTFNLAGLLLGNIVIKSRTLRERWRERVNPICNPLSLAAAQGAYRHGGPWLAALRAYLDDNFRLLKDRFDGELPDARFSIPGATYMAWVDLGAYFPDDTNLTKFFIENAGVIVEGGEMFVANGGRYVRLNIACPQPVLSEALDRIVAAVDATTTDKRSGK